MQVTELGEARRHRVHVEESRVDTWKLLPCDRRRHWCARDRPEAVGTGDRAVAGVLVVVHEDRGASLLLPPGGRDPRRTTGKLASEADGGVPHVGEAPARLDPHVDMHTPVAAGLGEPTHAQVLE